MFFVNFHFNPDLYLIFLECNWMSRLAMAHELYCLSCISLFPWEQYIWSFRERTTISLFAWEDFCSQNWHHLFSRWNLLSLNVVFCLCLFTAAIVFFEWSNDSSLHQTYVKRQLTIDPDSEKIKERGFLTLPWTGILIKLNLENWVQF